ncbi:hypothetical protein RvY_13485 [Ramazzottius varieornatus]|uniref:Uncharacterized protein n=1 Tax=Ramazzottius varieornatus TaxID=947166 RepID=A0A1D1VVI3_RAMVA|nr:hypothetical protein RvY_13485 [Ramazzottius varieornatus]
MAKDSWGVGEDTPSCSVLSGDESQPLYGWNLSPKCSKRVELDESSYQKNEYPSVPTDNPLRDSGNLSALIRIASRHVPLRHERTRRFFKRKRPLAFYGHPSITFHLEALRDVQKDIADIQRDLHNAIFMKQLSLLDNLQPTLNQRTSVIMSGPPDPPSIEPSPRSDGSGPEVWTGFWLSALENCLPASLLICPWDRPVLRHLLDIQCVVHKDAPSFTLNFVFGQNAYFSNPSLTRRFDFRQVSKAETIGDLRGLLSYIPACCTSCPVGWFPDKNITLTHKTSVINGAPAREIVPRRSFFNYFSPLTINSESIVALSIKQKHRKTLAKLFELDFYIANTIRTILIPHATAFNEGVSDTAVTFHPVRKAVDLDDSRMWTEAEIAAVEKRFIKLDLGVDHWEEKKKTELELDRDVKRALHSVGYKVRNRRACHREATTSGESSSDMECRDGEEARRKTYRGLLETNTVKMDRKHVGVKMSDLKKAANRVASDDDLVVYGELESRTEDSSQEEDISRMELQLSARKGALCRKKGGKVAQRKKKTVKKVT